MHGRAGTHVLAGFVADHSRCTAVEKQQAGVNSSLEIGMTAALEGKTHPVVPKAVLLKNGPPEILSNLIASLYQEL